MEKEKARTVEDINLDLVDLSRHTKVIIAGSEWYRIVDSGQDPLIQTGRASRFSKEPLGYTPERYREAWDIGHGQTISIGTGASYFCQSIDTAKDEAGGLDGKDIYKITLLLDIEVIDVDSICKFEGVVKPYITVERGEFWHNFYGRKVKGLWHESAKNPEDHNLVIFQDWFPDFRSLVKKEKIIK